MSQNNYRPVSHVIFDLDGLLINSEIVFAKSIAILLKRYGVNDYSRELQERVLGMEVEKGIQVIIDETGIPITVQEFRLLEKDIYEDEMRRVELMPGAERLVKHLHRHRIPMAIATGSTVMSFEIKTARYRDFFRVGHNFHHIVMSRDDPEVERPKPHPDIYLAAARRFRPTPAQPDGCLVFEDSGLGVDGARAAGMQCVMVPDSRWPCRQQNATQILATLLDFRPELYGLPPFDD
ncbi:probable pseudouridine-5'-phosphatase [Oppia nitens]|uniref:probable pseudouridine-5'-phosphatase n=1 Tax=Oppia nitens TaxID=1686743 RepID=UPI0023DB04B1|nr:probable pseudouridine-5'-phosphatase [Oppia nitens]